MARAWVRASGGTGGMIMIADESQNSKRESEKWRDDDGAAARVTEVKSRSLTTNKTWRSEGAQGEKKKVKKKGGYACVSRRTKQTQPFKDRMA